jgi:hypothetical protein
VCADPDVELHAARFDRAAALLAARGFAVTRVPVVVLPGAGSYVTYTNALYRLNGSLGCLVNVMARD